MSISDISPAAVLQAIREGRTDLPDLATHFGVLPSSLFLTDALSPLIAAGEVRVSADGQLIPQDLFTDLEEFEEEL